MADHHPEAVLNLLKSWRSVLNRQSEALEQGNVKDLADLVMQTLTIQQQLQGMLSASSPTTNRKMISDLLSDIHKHQNIFIEALKCQTEELAHEIRALQKNKSSLKGYKQKKTSIPRFMSERT